MKILKSKENTVDKLKVGFLVDDFEVGSRYLAIIDFVNKSTQFEKPTIIVCKKEPTKKFIFKLKYLVERFGFINFPSIVTTKALIKVILFLEKFLVRHKYQNNIPSISLYNFDCVIAEAEWSKSRLAVTLSKATITELGSKKLDVIIRCGSGILRGDILDISKFGVISFHHGDNRVNRGGPVGFWEVLNSEPSTGFVIQRLNNELDGGEVLARGNMATADLWTQNQMNILNKSNIFMIKLLEYIATNNKLPDFEFPTLHDRELYTLNTRVIILLKYMLKILLPVTVDKILNRTFKNKDPWQIAYSEFDGFKKSLWRYKQIPNQKGSWFADPFVYTLNKKSIIFVEEYVRSENKGCISAIDISSKEPKYLGKIITEDFHLSFPFIFEDKSVIYMIPECSSTNQIRLYQCIDFPLKWKFQMILMEGVDAADTMIIKSAGYYYLFSNICSAGIGDHNSELHIFHASELQTQKWQPLSQGNPILFHSQRARNGGMFSYRDNFFRISQSHTKGNYGNSFNINLIKFINEDSFEEVEIDRVLPNFFEGIKSTHTFNSDGVFSVVDFRRKKLV